MRSLRLRALLVAVTLVLAMPPSAQAYLGQYRVETVYLEPTASVLSVPATYVVSSSYVWPSTYVVPTVYTSSSLALAPTYYLSPTAYVVPTYRASAYYVPRRFVERPLITTTRRYYPALTATAWSYPLVATSAFVPAIDYCDGAPIASYPTSVPASKAANQGSAAHERRPSSVVDSVPMNEPGLTSEPSSPPSAEPSKPPATGDTTPAPGSATNPPPPAEPAPEVQSRPATPKSESNAPQASRSNLGTGDGVGAGVLRRDAQRPKSADAELKPTAASRTILEGKVITADSGRPEEGVRLIVSDSLGRSADRIATTDALGRYAISLPNGDWTVRVEMPSHKTYEVSSITVNGGKITNKSGQAVPSLTIKR